MDKFKCLKCNHIWTPRTENPQVCPKCHNWLDREPIAGTNRDMRLKKNWVKGEEEGEK